MADQKNDEKDNAQNDDLPEWLAQFKRELGAKSEEESYFNEDGPIIAADSEELKRIEAVNSLAKPYAFYELAGYDNAINSLCDLGFVGGIKSSSDGVVAALNHYHGLKSKPALRPIVISGKCYEDITPFLNAALEEMAQPTVKVDFSENSNGMPQMSINANGSAINAAQKEPALSWVARNNGIIIIEAVEFWLLDPPDQFFDFGNGVGAFIHFKMGGNVDVNEMIDIALDNPDVQIIVTTCQYEDIEADLLEFLGNVHTIEIDNPDQKEREELWTQISAKHPSLRMLNLRELASVSRTLSRFEIKQCAQEALSDSYYDGLKMGKVSGVTKENVFEKICLRVEDKDSEEFKTMQDFLLKSFSHSFDI